MPRVSAEAKAAAIYRAGSAPPKPPKHLSAAAAAIWREIAASKPADWFDPGARILLESYCQLAAHARELHGKLNDLREAGDWDECKAFEKRVALLSDKLTTLATKLRLSVQALMERQSRKILERGDQPAEPDRLLGGAAVWGDETGGRAN